MRTVYYYFARNYDPELAHRELTENSADGKGLNISVSNIYYYYVQARDHISRY
jgi:hypothetical protein